MAELTEWFDVQPKPVTQCKLQAVENVASTIDTAAAGEIAEPERMNLLTKIDQLTLE